MLPLKVETALRKVFGMRLEQKLLLINGHPDPSPSRFCAALCDSFEQGALSRGQEIRRFEAGMYATNESIRDNAFETEELFGWADKLMLVFPLWLNGPPHSLISLFDRLMRRKEALSARMIVTMDMPAFAHRNLLRNDRHHMTKRFALPGVATRKMEFIGSVSSASHAARQAWLNMLRRSDD